MDSSPRRPWAGDVWCWCNRSYCSSKPSNHRRVLSRARRVAADRVSCPDLDDTPELPQPIQLISPPAHHAYPFLPELSRMCVGAPNFILLLMRKLAFDCVGMPFAAFHLEELMPSIPAAAVLHS